MKLFEKFQNALGVSKSELIAVFVLLGGLGLGFIAKSLTQDRIESDKNYQALAKSLDSLAEASKKDYVGTDIKDKPRESKSGKGDAEKLTVNINTASKLELMKLPWVGPKTAIKIMDFRKKRKFKRKEDIKKIRGIGEKKFEKMEPFIVVK